MALLSLLLLSAASVPVLAADPPCPLRDVSTALLREEVLTTREKYLVRDQDDPYFRAEADVEAGTLHIEIVTKRRNGSRSKNIFGSDQFRKIVEHFDGKFNSIEGSWIFGDNLNTVNTLSSKPGISLEQAIRETWTAKQAARIGFNKIEIIEKTGSRGHYQDLSVRFHR